MSAPPGHPKCTKNCGKIQTKIHIGEIIGLPPPPLTWHTNGVGEWKNLGLKIKNIYPSELWLASAWVEVGLGIGGGLQTGSPTDLT